MYNSELTALLCRKLNEEQEAFRGWLVKQPAEEILRFAQQYAVRQDIISIAESNDLPEAQAVALLKMQHPLASVFEEFQSRAPYYDGVVLEALEACSGRAAGKHREAANRQREQRPSIREQLKATVKEQAHTPPKREKGQER